MSSKSRKFDIDIVANELVKASVKEKNSLLFALLKDLIRVDKTKEFLRTIDKVILTPEEYVTKHNKDLKGKDKEIFIKLITLLQI